MFSCAVLTAAPVEVAPRPLLARALVAWLRAASAAICAAVVDVVVAGAPARLAAFADTVPASALVDWFPLPGSRSGLMIIWSSMFCLCHYCAATAIYT
jgi:hypothetical protein